MARETPANPATLETGGTSEGLLTPPPSRFGDR